MTNFILGEGEEEYVEGIWSMYIVVSFVIYISGLNMEHSLKLVYECMTTFAVFGSRESSTIISGHSLLLL